MSHPIKIATCCYCGARTMLKPTARDGHELACASCAAPLHEMKWLKMPEREEPKRLPKRRVASAARPRKLKRKKHKLHRLKDWLEDAWDEIEDIFD
ncbi:MAG: hypothetical protein HKP40_01340 [Litoreibacter sp.]|nr:hypothetical protein [Litoreibacter sp.]